MIFLGERPHSASAEGTLGVIAELTIELRGIPETIAAAACSFGTVGGACQAAIFAIQTGIPMARIELLNAEYVRAYNAYSKLTLPETPLLLQHRAGGVARLPELLVPAGVRVMMGLF
jgi:D-lactate dehydrogenase (cytochrome)